MKVNLYTQASISSKKKEMSKERPFSKNNWYKYLIDYIPERIKRHWVSTREELGVFFKQTQKIRVEVKRDQKSYKKKKMHNRILKYVETRNL